MVAEFLVVTSDICNEELIRKGIRVAAVYITHCRHRHSALSGHVTVESLALTTNDLIRGHVAAMRARAVAHVSCKINWVLKLIVSGAAGRASTRIDF